MRTEAIKRKKNGPQKLTKNECKIRRNMALIANKNGCKVILCMSKKKPNQNA